MQVYTENGRNFEDFEKKKREKEKDYTGLIHQQICSQAIRHQTGRNLIDGTCLSPEPMDT